MKQILNNLIKEAKGKHIENKKYFDKLKKKQPKNLDYMMQDLHQAEFKKTDCLTCANCCKTTGPFLDTENYCMIYEVRPKACREFPHTDRKKFHQISDLTLQNVAICPAAYNIVEEMKKRMPL